MVGRSDEARAGRSTDRTRDVVDKGRVSDGSADVAARWQFRRCWMSVAQPQSAAGDRLPQADLPAAPWRVLFFAVIALAGKSA